MRPVEIQNSFMQAPAAERATQQQVAQPQVAQQTFQQQLERTATLRPSQVQATQPAASADEVAISPDEHGEQRRRRRQPRREAAVAPAPGVPATDGALPRDAAEPTPPPGRSKIDVVV